MNAPVPDPWTNAEFEQSVRDTAYFLWEQDGKPNGREQDYWFAALERHLRRRQSDQELNRSLSERDNRRDDDGNVGSVQPRTGLGDDRQD